MQPIWFMEHDSPEPTELSSPTPASPALGNSLPATTPRHDGWTGDKMAIFCEALADTAVVAEACDQAGMGISGAYALRRRSAFFAAAWDAALTIARERLADTLLARSIEGNVEQIWRDGELVGERHVIDNRLGLAILRRLDRLAETGSPLHSTLPSTFRSEGSREAPAPAKAFDWEQALDVLRTGDPEAIAASLALIKSNEVEEVEDPRIRPAGDAEPKEIDLSDRCWKDPTDDNLWLTDFPPPARFAGYQNRPYDEEEEDNEAYERACTAREAAILDADLAAARAAERAEDEELRDAWFAILDGTGDDAG